MLEVLITVQIRPISIGVLVDMLFFSVPQPTGASLPRVEVIGIEPMITDKIRPTKRLFSGYVVVSRVFSALPLSYDWHVVPAEGLEPPTSPFSKDNQPTADPLRVL
jgi:hypothetical protein